MTRTTRFYITYFSTTRSSTTYFESYVCFCFWSIAFVFRILPVTFGKLFILFRKINRYTYLLELSHKDRAERGTPWWLLLPTYHGFPPFESRGPGVGHPSDWLAGQRINRAEPGWPREPNAGPVGLHKVLPDKTMWQTAKRLSGCQAFCAISLCRRRVRSVSLALHGWCSTPLAVTWMPHVGSSGFKRG